MSSNLGRDHPHTSCFPKTAHSGGEIRLIRLLLFFIQLPHTQHKARIVESRSATPQELWQMASCGKGLCEHTQTPHHSLPFTPLDRSVNTVISAIKVIVSWGP